MAALLNDPTSIDCDESVHMHDRRQAVCNGKHRLTLHNIEQSFLNICVELGIKRRRCFIQNEDGCAPEKDSSECDPLTLASRQFETALADMGLKALSAVSILQPLNELQSMRAPCSGDNLRS